jgi:molybdopterin-guanine dinucleotide biosynthesis protein A
MGRDKADLPHRGRTLLDHMIHMLSAVCGPVRAVGRGALTDRVPGLGPLGGIATALAASETDRMLVVAVDLPLLTPEFLDFLAERTLASPHPLIACRTGSGYPLCLGLDRSLEPLARGRLESNRLAVHAFIDAADPEIVPEEEILAEGFPAEMFSNFNTPEDWAGLFGASGHR